MNVEAMAVHLAHKCATLEGKVAKAEETKHLAAEVRCLEMRLGDVQSMREEAMKMVRTRLKEKLELRLT